MYLERFESIRARYWEIVSFGLVAKVLNLIKASLLVYFLKESYDFLGEYNIAFSGTMLLTGIGVTGIHFALIPGIQKAEMENGLEGRMSITNKFVNAGIVISIPIIALVVILAPNIVRYLSPGASRQEISYLAGLIRMGSPIMTLHFIRAVGVGYLQSDHRFVAGAKSGVANVLVYIIYIILFRNNLTARGMIVAGLFAVASQIYVIMEALYGDGYRYKFEVDFEDKYVKKTFKYLIPIAIGTLLLNLVTRIDGYSLANIGSTYSLGEIGSIINDISSLFIVALITTIYPILSRNYLEGRMDELRKNTKFGFYILLVVMLPIGLGLNLLAGPIVGASFTDQALDSEDILAMTRIFQLTSISMIGSIFYMYTTRMYYALLDYKKPIILGIVYLGLNYLFNNIFTASLGVLGVVLSTVLALAIIIIYSIYDYNKRLDFIDMEDFKQNILIIIGSLITMFILMLIVKWAFNSLFEASQIRSLGLLIIASISGGLVYSLSMRESLGKLKRKEKFNKSRKKKK